MRVEIRNNSVHLDGYVNVHTRDSKELVTPKGKFVEQIMPKAFSDSLQKRSSVDLLFNHRSDRKLGSISDGNLELFEDVIGLRAICTVTDEEVVNKAKSGDLKGWSFGFVATEQRWEDANNGMQRRFVDSLDLIEVSILDCSPAYIATTIEARGDDSVIVEQRFEERDMSPAVPTEIEERAEEEQVVIAPDYSVVETQILIDKLKGGL